MMQQLATMSLNRPGGWRYSREQSRWTRAMRRWWSQDRDNNAISPSAASGSLERGLNWSVDPPQLQFCWCSRRNAFVLNSHHDMATNLYTLPQRTELSARYHLRDFSPSFGHYLIHWGFRHSKKVSFSSTYVILAFSLMATLIICSSFLVLNGFCGPYEWLFSCYDGLVNPP